MSDTSNIERRRRRVQRLKKMIVVTFFLLVIIPTVICIWLAVSLHVTRNNLSEMNAQYEAQLKITTDLQSELEEETMARIAAEAEAAEAAVAINLEGDIDDTVDVAKEDVRKVYLTFDDGPSIYTEQILDILDEYGVKATFFVTGENAEKFPERYQMIADRGHTLGMHSYSHIYSEVYRDKDSFIADLEKIQGFLTGITGKTPVIYRFPGGSSNTVSATDMNELCAYLTEQGITYFDWNVSSGDASSQTLSADRIVANCLAGVSNNQNAVVLLHDTSAKYSTVAALPVILEQIQAMDNTEILPITEDTVAVQHRESKEIE